MNFPILITERLRLRQLSLADAPGLFRLRSDPDYCALTLMSVYHSVKEVEGYIGRILDGYKNGENLTWTITLKDADLHMGGVCLFNYSQDKKRAEIGYDLLPEHRGMGIVTEAVRAVAAHAFDNGTEVVFADLLPINAKSVALIERIGFIKKSNHTREGPNNQPINMALYELHHP